MKIDAKFYMHDSDRIALQALRAIPGFTQLFKAFMKVWSEKQFRIQYVYEPKNQRKAAIQIL